MVSTSANSATLNLGVDDVTGGGLGGGAWQLVSAISSTTNYNYFYLWNGSVSADLIVSGMQVYVAPGNLYYFSGYLTPKATGSSGTLRLLIGTQTTGVVQIAYAGSWMAIQQLV